MSNSKSIFNEIVRNNLMIRKSDTEKYNFRNFILSKYKGDFQTFEADNTINLLTKNISNEDNCQKITCIIVAHYDTLGSKNFNDNTSGISALLAIMESIKNTQYTNKVAFILTDLEEQHCKGAKAIYDKYKYIFKNKVVINLDCIGGDYNKLVICINKKSDLCNYGITTLTHELITLFKDKKYLEYIDNYSLIDSDYKVFKNSYTISPALRPPQITLAILVHTCLDNKVNFNNIEVFVNVIVNHIKQGKI